MTMDISRRKLLGATVASVGALAATPVMALAQGQRASLTSAAYLPVQARGWACYEINKPLRPLTFQRRALGPHDVAFDIHYCGVCHSDIHHCRGDWGPQHLPLVPGHELAGVVVATGSAVTTFKPGDRVSVGCMVDSCGVCEDCRSGLEQYCTKQTLTYNSPSDDPGGYTQGGYSSHVVVRDQFVIHVPDNIQLAAAGPIMCSGVTLFSPLRHWNIRAGSVVGIAGMGGLGHIGVMLAKAMGAKVIVLSTSASKVADARKFGASDVIINHDDVLMQQYQRSLDLIIDTIPYRHNIEPMLRLLKRDGTLCMVGVGKADEPTTVGPFSLVLKRNALAGSVIGSIRETQEVIDFCSLHNISPQIELIAARDINNAWDRVVNKQARYRYVIDMKTLTDAS